MNRTQAMVWILLILCKEFRMEPIAVPGPSSGVMTQDLPGFILTDKRIISQKIYVSLDPKVALERRFNISEFRSPEIQEWFRMHLEYSNERIRQIMESTRKTFIKDSPSPARRPKRFISAVVAAIVFAVVGSVIATGVSAANAISIKRHEMELSALKRDLLDIQGEVDNLRQRLRDSISVIKDTVVTTNLNTQMILRSTNLHRNHEDFKRELLFVKDPISLFTQIFFDEVQSGMNDLREGRIPLYFVSKDIIRKMLQGSEGNAVEDNHVNLAFNMGNAIPLYIDPERMDICFLLSIPYVTSNNIFLMKKVHNVGTWREDVHIKIQTPDIVAYQPWVPDWYSVPMLDNCVKFRDNNYQCDGNPFHYDATSVLCGLEYEKHGSETCQVSLSKPALEDNTHVVLIHDKWLVSTSLSNMSVFKTDQVLNKVVSLPANVSIIKVPQGSRITVGKYTLYPVEFVETEGVVEEIDAFKNKDIPINADLQFLLSHKSNHTVKMNIREESVTVHDTQFLSADDSLLNSFAWDYCLNYIWGTLIFVNIVWLGYLTRKLIRWINYSKRIMAKFWTEHHKSDLKFPIPSELR